MKPITDAKKELAAKEKLKNFIKKYSCTSLFWGESHYESLLLEIKRNPNFSMGVRLNASKYLNKYYSENK